MQFQKKEKRQTTVRFDSHHVRLRTGEVQRKTGSYMYRWTDKLGKRNTIYAATLEDLREQEEQILVDQHVGIKANNNKYTPVSQSGIGSKGTPFTDKFKPNTIAPAKST